MSMQGYKDEVLWWFMPLKLGLQVKGVYSGFRGETEETEVMENKWNKGKRGK